MDGRQSADRRPAPDAGLEARQATGAQEPLSPVWLLTAGKHLDVLSQQGIGFGNGLRLGRRRAGRSKVDTVPGGKELTPGRILKSVEDDPGQFGCFPQAAGFWVDTKNGSGKRPGPRQALLVDAQGAHLPIRPLAVGG